MKSYNHLYEKFISSENYYLAVRNATKRKGGRKHKYRIAQWYRDHAEEAEASILEYASTFRNAAHKPKFVYDGIRRKQREIYVPTMQEMIIQHMIINVLRPIFMKGMYEHSYGSVPGRGAHSAKKVIEKWIRKDNKRFKYILKMDIRKYFDSVPHDILKKKLAKLIHDERFLNLLYTIIDVKPEGKGIPIGFFTSQWFANWYLQDLDHYIKEVLKAPYYVRYMDDMVIAGPNKKELCKMKTGIESYLQKELGLCLKDNWQIYKFDYEGKGRDLDFMGFRFFRGRTILRKSILLKIKRKAKRLNKKGLNIYTVRQMLSYLGWINHTDTYQMFKSYIKPFISIRACKHYVSAWDLNNKKGVNINVV